LATDVDANGVDRARQGSYHEWSLRGVDPARRERYFAASDHQRVELHRTIRRMVRFTTLSIQEHLGLMKPRSIDAILFRNVAIYLAADALEKLYRRLAGVLRPDGLLFIGPCDPVPPSDTFVATGDTATFSKTPVVSPFPRGDLEDRLPVAPDPLVFDAQPSVSEPATPSAGQRDLDQKPSQRDLVEADMAGAVRLADAGNIDAALHIADRLLGEDEENARAHMLRGQLRLAQRDFPGAVADFRSALFLRSDDPMARYWLAIALWRDGAARRCLLQLNALAVQLAELGDDVILEDGETTVAELARALTHTRECL
jgi:chemotaxis protein methyltransferase CheR